MEEILELRMEFDTARLLQRLQVLREFCGGVKPANEFKFKFK